MSSATQPLATFFESMYSTCVGCSATSSSPTTASTSQAARTSLGGAQGVTDEWQTAAAQSESGDLRISAESYRINIGTHLPLRARGSATASNEVRWSVEEGAAGGKVTDTGVYIAPLVPGMYHVIAISGSERARLAINVFTVR